VCLVDVVGDSKVSCYMFSPFLLLDFGAGLHLKLDIGTDCDRDVGLHNGLVGIELGTFCEMPKWQIWICSSAGVWNIFWLKILKILR